MESLVGDDFAQANSRFSDLISVKNVVKSRREPDLVTTADVIGATAVGPAYMAVKAAKKLLPGLTAKGLNVAGKAGEKVASAVEAPVKALTTDITAGYDLSKLSPLAKVTLNQMLDKYKEDPDKQQQILDQITKGSS
jgi:hypothetical protein